MKMSENYLHKRKNKCSSQTKCSYVKKTVTNGRWWSFTSPIL